MADRARRSARSPSPSTAARPRPSRGEMLISAAERAGTYIPRFCYHPRMRAGGHVPDVPGRGERAPGGDPAAGLLHLGDRGHGGHHRLGQGEKGAGRRARVPPGQPPARLPGLRQGRRVPAAGPDPGLRARREPLRRGEAPLREARPHLRPGAARPGALHPVRPLHPLRRGGGRRGPDRLRRPGGPGGGGHLPRPAVLLLLQRQHRADLPGRGADRHPLPLQCPALGPRPGRVDLHHLRPGLPGGRPVLGQPADPPAGHRRRPGQPRVALRQGPLRLRVGQRHRRGGGAAGAAGAAEGDRRRRRPGSPSPWSARTASWWRSAGTRPWPPPPRGWPPPGRPVAPRPWPCSAGPGPPTRAPTPGPSLAKGVLRTDSVDAQLGDGLPAELVLSPAPGHHRPGGCAARRWCCSAGDLREELPVLFLRLRQAALDGGTRWSSWPPGPRPSPATPRSRWPPAPGTPRPWPGPSPATWRLPPPCSPTPRGRPGRSTTWPGPATCWAPRPRGAPPARHRGRGRRGGGAGPPLAGRARRRGGRGRPGAGRRPARGPLPAGPAPGQRARAPWTWAWPPGCSRAG